MRLNRGDQIAGVDGLQLRKYFRRFGSEYVTYATVMKEFSVTRREAENIVKELLKLEMICLCELQVKREMLSYQTTMKGNALGMAKAGRPITRASAERVLQELLERVRVVNKRAELAYRVQSVVVFGSYLSRAERINDLDIAVELKAKRNDDASFESFRNASLERAQAFQRCANELELALKNSRPMIAATALLAGAIVLSEPLFDRHEWHGSTTDTLAASYPSPTESPVIPADHTHEDRSGENLRFTVSGPAASGSNVAAGVSHTRVDVADDLRS